MYEVYSIRGGEPLGDPPARSDGRFCDIVLVFFVAWSINFSIDMLERPICRNAA
eukprot:SAG11_NODE_22568_length_403_cov_2.694079_1_plen_53_part_01